MHLAVILTNQTQTFVVGPFDDAERAQAWIDHRVDEFVQKGISCRIVTLIAPGKMEDY